MHEPRDLHRRLLPLGGAAALAAVALLACAPASPTADVAASDAGGDASSGPVCLACGGGTPEELDASLAFKVKARFALCDGQEGCHVTNAGGLTYPPGNELAYVVNVASTERPELARVRPGDPGASYVYLKVAGDGGIEGGRMPLGQSTFDPRVAATLFAWIEAGAPGE